MRGVRATVCAFLLAGGALAQEVPPPALPETAPVPVPVPGPAQPLPLPSSLVEADDGAALIVAPVLTVDEEALFSGSAWGRRVKADLDADGAALQAENDRIAEELATEEAALTARRATTDAAEFRRLAEAFDARATEVRRERAQAAADLSAGAEADRAAFYRAALPVMGRMMQERGAVAVLDQRTVFVSLDVIDITAALIGRLDAELGDGSNPSAPTLTPTEAAPPATGN